MPKVFFLGCNTDQIPYLRAAQNLGFTVVGTDMNPNAPGAALAERFHRVSYTDTDGLVQMAEAEGYRETDHVFTAASHFAYQGAAHLAAALGIPFVIPDAVDICIDKTKFYSFLQERDVPVPPTCLFDTASPPMLDPRKVYFIKSDYGKSPRYCYRIADGQVPTLPQTYDQFYRRHFLLQEAVEGTHFRLNLYAGQAAVFLKFSDTASVPVRVLGPGHTEVIAKLNRIVSELRLEAFLTKFDLIVNEEGWYVIDIGLDPPLRLKLLCDYLGLDFPAAYVHYYLLGDTTSMPAWTDICLPVAIQGAPQLGFTFTPLEGKV